MYPELTLFGLKIDMYTLFLCVGIISALLTFRLFSDYKKMYWKLQNFSIIVAVVSIVGGYGSAVLFQAFYDFLDDTSKGFQLNSSTGATFYGGLIGGAGLFLLLYFGLGRFFFKEKEHINGFFDIANIAAAAIAAAHGFGRIGCFMAGCCYGRETDAWYGVYFSAYGIKAVPVQLFEALFLFALFGFFWYRIVKRKSCNLPLYMMLYGVWRFVIEFFRDDDRGATVVKFLSPSQLIAILMVLGAIAIFFGERYIEKKLASKVADAEVLASDAELKSAKNEESRDDAKETEEEGEKNED